MFAAALSPLATWSAWGLPRTSGTALTVLASAALAAASLRQMKATLAGIACRRLRCAGLGANSCGKTRQHQRYVDFIHSHDVELLK
jgi:hypothetical protein